MHFYIICIQRYAYLKDGIRDGHLGDRTIRVPVDVRCRSSHTRRRILKHSHSLDTGHLETEIRQQK